MPNFHRGPLLKSLWRTASKFVRPTDPPGVERAELRFYIHSLRAGMTVVDVGANVGEMSLLFARLVGEKGHVHAFEPVRETHSKLAEICRLAGRSQIRTVQKAVSDRTGEVEIRVYDGSYASWSTMAERPLETYGHAIKPKRVERVASVSLDDYCAANGIQEIDLLKIDAEGAEYQVLQGARRLLAEKRIRRCIFEFGGTTFDMGNKPEQIAAYLSGLGYKLRNVVTGDPLFPGGMSAAEACFSMLVAEPS